MPLILNFHHFLFFCAFLFDGSHVCEKQNHKHDHEKNRGKRVDFRADTLFNHRIDRNRKRLYVSCRKITDNKIVQRIRKRHQKAGNDTRHDFRKNDLHKCLGGRTSKVQRRLIQASVHLTNLRQDGWMVKSLKR